jgi:exodeoxyribonuclease V beta subunit
MTAFLPLQLIECPLEGTNLIEASAGTGKTYAITGLYLRLVLEKKLSVDQILVVTFTEAATEELKDRIRKHLRLALDAFGGRPREDPFVAELVKREKQADAAAHRLRDAIRAFDEAAIFTIHGFCMRTLYEHAFESGTFFDTQLLTDQETLKREIVEDYWRRHLYQGSPLFVHYALSAGVSPEALFSLLSRGMHHLRLKIVPQTERRDTKAQEEACLRAFNEVLEAWPSSKEEVASLLQAEGLSRVKYDPKKIPLWVQGMDDFVLSGRVNARLFPGFRKFTRSEVEGGTKKGQAPPRHRFFDLCENLWTAQQELEDAFAHNLLWLKVQLFEYVDSELERRKREKNVQSFDDLLLKLSRALEGGKGKDLAGAIRKRFRAALIDEFQDTDPIQYAIFRHIFASKDSVLFLVGDPKQAIYSFRGADIFAYMEAAGEVETRYTLEENWRSEPALIQAVNHLFSARRDAFVYDRIQFLAARPAKKKQREGLTVDQKAEPALRLWFMDAREWAKPGNPINKGRGWEVIPRAVASEISSLLSLGEKGRALIGERALSAADVAVLVRRNVEAKIMQQALGELRIPSVLYTTDNLLDSHEAGESERILAAIAKPDDESLIRAALATDMLAVTGEELDALRGEEGAWERWLLKFKGYHEDWKKQGFIRMFRSFLRNEGVLIRLMGLPDGERRDTNILHLMEVLHRIGSEKKLDPPGLLKWLSEQRDPETPRLEEHQLRLESDERAVKIVTVHKSKGLEYPVVFCPFMWGGSRIRSAHEPFTFHDERDRMALTLDLGSPERDANRGRAELEMLAESLRLFYVALTRARYRCYLVWGRFREAETSPAAYLFDPSPSSGSDEILSRLEERFRSLTDKELFDHLKKTSDRAGGVMDLSPLRVKEAAPYAPLRAGGTALSPKTFSGPIDREWKISSFSSLTSGRAHGEETADHDARAFVEIEPGEAFQEVPEPRGIFAFPKGTRAGTFVHDLLEHLDFSEKDETMLRSLAAQKLEAYGFDPSWLDAVCGMVRRVLSVPLAADRDDFSLSSVRKHERLNELEFYFPLKPLSPRLLQEMLLKSGLPGSVSGAPERIGDLVFAPLRGFLKGFMDLVFEFEDRFYLVDWKSNDLGPSVDHYGPSSLAAAMDQGFYTLQYFIYTVALNQYLRNRVAGYDYETHFGGVYYIFVRGVDPARGREFGIFRDRPSSQLVHEWTRMLMPGERG